MQRRQWIHWAKDDKYRAARLKEKRKRPQTRLMEVMKDDMKRVSVTEEIGGRSTVVTCKGSS